MDWLIRPSLRRTSDSSTRVGMTGEWVALPCPFTRHNALSSASPTRCPMRAPRNRPRDSSTRVGMTMERGVQIRHVPLDGLLTKEGSPAAAANVPGCNRIAGNTDRERSFAAAQDDRGGAALTQKTFTVGRTTRSDPWEARPGVGHIDPDATLRTWIGPSNSSALPRPE
jgi:hypothetical protein